MYFLIGQKSLFLNTYENRAFIARDSLYSRILTHIRMLFFAQSVNHLYQCDDVFGRGLGDHAVAEVKDVSAAG